MLYQQRKYIQFLLEASNEHSVHSPFIYQLVTQCFYKQINKSLWKTFQNARQYLIENKNKINVTDFGAGSKIFKTNERQISKIVKVAGISKKKAKILIKTINYFRPANILEIGTSLGLGTSAIKIANESAAIITLEGCTETSEIARKLFNKNNFNAINIVNGNFSETLPKYTQNKQFDFILFDGNHTKKATLSYFEACLKTIHNDSFFMFDDIYWTAEMQEAWSAIKGHSKVTITVDLFYFGIVFFRKEQAKEHFKIRV
jgi:predicted O-methyltransferase YrrM